MAASITEVPRFVLRHGKSLSLDRTTEKEGLVVDEGFCLVDTNFAVVADRLACLEMENLEQQPLSNSRRAFKADSQVPSEGSNSSKSLQTLPQPHHSRVQRGDSAKSLGPRVSSCRSVVSDKECSAEMQMISQPSESQSSLRSNLSLPPGSPFGHPEVQNACKDENGADEIEDELSKLKLSARLLSGLQSLSGEELALYLQVTEELKQDNHPASSKQKAPNPARGVMSVRSEDEERRLESAISKLKALLPESAIDQLQTHSSYGLMDVINSRPSAPPPSPQL